MIWFDFSALEWVTITCTLLYNFLLVRQKISCWVFGILSSISGAVIFVQHGLWGQLLLYIFYAAMGFYGWWYWYKGDKHERQVITWSMRKQLIFFFSGLAVSLGFIFVYRNVSPGSGNIELDVFLTVFSFIATFKEAQKVLTGWIYWIVLNGLSFFLYTRSGLHGLALLSVVYTFLSVIGFIAWRRSYLEACRQAETV